MEIKLAIEEALTETSQIDLLPSKEEFETLESIVDVLETVEASATKLGANDMDIGQAGKVMEFMLMSLSDNDSAFGKRMKKAMFKRLNERRLPRLAGLMRYLLKDELEEDSPLSYPSRTRLTKRD